MRFLNQRSVHQRPISSVLRSGFVHVEEVLGLIVHPKEELTEISYDWDAIYDALSAVL